MWFEKNSASLRRAETGGENLVQITRPLDPWAIYDVQMWWGVAYGPEQSMI